MQTATLTFVRGRVCVFTGIKAKKQSGKYAVDLYETEERSVPLHYYPPRIAQFCKKPGEGDGGQLYLDRLTLIFAPSGILYACEEVDTFDDVLLFVETYDREAKVECFGTCIRPTVDRAMLPFNEAKSLSACGDYGLVLLHPGESILLRSSTFSGIRLEYSKLGVFQSHECTPFERDTLCGVRSHT